MEAIGSPPPPYLAERDGFYQDIEDDGSLPKYGDLPADYLTLTPSAVFASRLFLSGGTRTPDLTVSTDDNHCLYRLETDSTLVYHETFVKDLRGPKSLFRIRRHTIQGKAENVWRYAIQTSSRSKILEVETDPGMVSHQRSTPWSTRLIFRNSITQELDAVTLQTKFSNSGEASIGGEVFYQGKSVADIINKQRREPSFEIRIFRDGLDPLLIVILAYIIDDRIMGNKRRNRRPRMSGFAGVGKGPGAGLAGLYGIGALI